VSSPLFPLPSATFPSIDVVMPCHASFLWSQDEHVTSASSFGNASSYRLSSRVKTSIESTPQLSAPFPDSPTPTLYCYKKVISILTILPTTQLYLYFTSSLARASCHQSSTCHHNSLSPLSRAHHSSAQQHLWWWTSRPCFTSRTIYHHVNSCIKIF
jgi:hypothetical protein